MFRPGAAGDGLDADFDSGLPVAYDSSGLHVLDGSASFVQSLQGNAGAQYYSSSMARLTSRAASVAPSRPLSMPEPG